MESIRLSVYSPSGDRIDFGNGTRELPVKSLKRRSGIGNRRALDVVTESGMDVGIGLGEGWTYIVISTK